MKYGYLFVFILVFILVQCKKSDDEVFDNPVEEKQVSVFLSMSNASPFNNEESVCSSIGDIHTRMDFGISTEDKFRYTGGIQYAPAFSVKCHIQDSINIGSTLLFGDMITYLENQNNKSVLFEFSYSTENEEYKNLWYNIKPTTPYINPIKYDINADDNYRVGDIETEECLDIIPSKY